MKLWKGIPTVMAEEMARIDGLAMNTFQLSLYSMMENAGRSLAFLAKQVLSGVEGKSVVCLIGPGHNGGGGCVVGRHLANWGAAVNLVTAGSPTRFHQVTAHQYQVLQQMKVPSSTHAEFESVDLVIDALLGYGGKGNPREPIASLITQANTSGLPILALDNPSGLDVTTGVPNTPCIRAFTTLTLALLKTGLVTEQARPYVGNLYLVDIGIPTAVYRVVIKSDVSIFHETSLIDLSNR